MRFADRDLEHTTVSTAQQRIDRAIWLVAGVEMLADAIALGSPATYSPDEAANIVMALAWEAGMELAAISEAASTEYAEDEGGTN